MLEKVGFKWDENLTKSAGGTDHSRIISLANAANMNE